MNLADVLRIYADEADGAATRTGRAAYRRAAALLRREADRAEAQAAADRVRGQRRRERKEQLLLGLSPGAESRLAIRDIGGRPPGGSRFTGTGPQRRRLLREES